MVGHSPSPPDIDTLLDRAVQAARRGDFAEARATAEDALLSSSSEKLPLLAFLGMTCARLGDMPAAAQHLAKAHFKKPADVTIACNLIAALMDQGRDADAFSVATADLAVADPSLRVARYRAFLAQKLEQFPEAIASYERVLAVQPDDFECWNNLGNARAGNGDYIGAVAALQRAVDLDHRAAPSLLNLASALAALDRTVEAEAVLAKATSDFPQNPRAPFQLYLLHKSQWKQEEALAALLTAAERDPRSADIQLKLGIEFGVLRRTEDAERAYRRAIELDPAELDAYLGLAIQMEHTNREDEFAPLIALARRNGIAPEPLAFIEALDLRRAKRFGEALEKLALVPESVETIRTAHIRATLLDRLERTDEAFVAYVHANALMQESPVEPLRMARELRGQLAAEVDLLTPDWCASLPSAESGDTRPDPVFLVGFPRSGTTLLDTILMGHPDTAVMEEQPPLNTVEETLGGMKNLPNLDAAAIAAARDRYFTEVARIQPLSPGQTLVDKSPLFLYRLPLIRQLFPAAKIILALRHPCDVVLSCFMSNFRINSAMANFLRIEDTAALYDVCFSHWQRSRELLGGDIHSVSYERLVEDVEAEVRPLIDWLGLEWHDTLLDHTATARSRGLITTASYSQVTEPIYRRASGRWKRYEENLVPVIPVLQPWIVRFGYAGQDAETGDTMGLKQ